MAERCADRAVDIANGLFDSHTLAAFDSLLAEGDQLAIKGMLQTMVLLLSAINLDIGVWLLRRRKDRRQIDALSFPVADRVVGFQAIDAANQLIEFAEAELSHD